MQRQVCAEEKFTSVFNQSVLYHLSIVMIHKSVSKWYLPFISFFLFLFFWQKTKPIHAGDLKYYVTQVEWTDEQTSLWEQF